MKKERMAIMNKKWVLTIVVMIFSLSVEAYAIPITETFSGVNLEVVGEFINAVPVSPEIFAPF